MYRSLRRVRINGERVFVSVYEGARARFKCPVLTISIPNATPMRGVSGVGFARIQAAPAQILSSGAGGSVQTNFYKEHRDVKCMPKSVIDQFRKEAGPPILSPMRVALL